MQSSCGWYSRVPLVTLAWAAAAGSRVRTAVRPDSTNGRHLKARLDASLLHWWAIKSLIYCYCIRIPPLPFSRNITGAEELWGLLVSIAWQSSYPAIFQPGK
jgi:hypothetical protein